MRQGSWADLLTSGFLLASQQALASSDEWLLLYQSPSHHVKYHNNWSNQFHYNIRLEKILAWTVLLKSGLERKVEFQLLLLWLLLLYTMLDSVGDHVSPSCMILGISDQSKLLFLFINFWSTIWQENDTKWWSPFTFSSVCTWFSQLTFV